jgi:hypothetical protein
MTFGEMISGGVAHHTCDMNQHIIDHCKHTTPASNREFLAPFFKEKVRSGIVSVEQLRQYALK